MADQFSEFFDGFPSRMSPERLGNWKASVLLDIVGDGGGKWLVSVADGKMGVCRDGMESAETTITVGAADFQQIISGKMNPNMAFMTGKLKVKGAMGHAVKMGGLLMAK